MCQRYLKYIPRKWEKDLVIACLGFTQPPTSLCISNFLSLLLEKKTRIQGKQHHLVPQCLTSESTDPFENLIKDMDPVP